MSVKIINKILYRGIVKEGYFAALWVTFHQKCFC